MELRVTGRVAVTVRVTFAVMVEIELGFRAKYPIPTAIPRITMTNKVGMILEDPYEFISLDLDFGGSFYKKVGRGLKSSRDAASLE